MTDRNLSPYDYLSPLDARYYGNEPEFFAALHPYLSEQANVLYLLKIEQALMAELEASGVAPKGISARVAEAVRDITPAEVYEEENRIQHNIRALVNRIRARLPKELQGYVHLFATSNDITDTARSLAIRDVTRDVVLPDVCELVRVLSAAARRYADLPQIGRTHGQHAEPVTVGYWLANYVERLGRRAELISSTAADLRGQLSGAVGAHNSLALRWPEDPAGAEVRVLARLGLRPSDSSLSTQLVQPEHLVDYAHALVSAFSVLADLADDCRHLMRSELAELGERSGAARVGSSTMPHKVNPKNFENVKSLWKAFVPRMLTMYMDQLSEHQRDLTNSASMRFFNELIAAFDYATRRLAKASADIEVNEGAVRRNLEASGQWTIAEPLYIALALSGHPDPYDASRTLVNRARERGVGLREVLKDDSEAQELMASLSAEHREIVLDPARYTGDAAKLAVVACDRWAERLSLAKLQDPLARPAEDQALVVAP